MTENNNFFNFLNHYKSLTILLNDKIIFFKNLSDNAYSEITRLLPKINRSLKEMLKKLELSVNGLYEKDIGGEELKDALKIIDELKEIPDIILQIMTSVQVQDEVEQCIDHIIKSIKTTTDLMDKANRGRVSDDELKLIKYLSIMPKLLVAQLKNIYSKMDENLCFLPRKFQAIFEILRPPLTLEELLDEVKEKNKLEILREELVKIIDDDKDVLPQKKESILETINEIKEIEGGISEVTNFIDVSAAASRRLQQPLTEILFLNHNLENAAASANRLLSELFDSSPEKIDCRDLLKKVVFLFSTKSEIEIARFIIKDIEIEESGVEGELELF